MKFSRLFLTTLIAIISSGCAATQKWSEPYFNESSTVAKTSFWVENQNKLGHGQFTPQVRGSVSHQFNEKWGLYGYFQDDEFYGQTYVGPTLKIAPWLQIGAAAGLETADDPLRFGSFFLASNEKCSLLGVYEHSAADDFYNIEFNAKMGDHLGIGAMARDGFGVGPRVEYNFTDNLKLWGGLLYDWNDDGAIKGLVGLRLSF